MLQDSYTEHPRARGENAAHGGAAATRRGNIPAHAGKTNIADGGDEINTEHPRARGENRATGFIDLTSRGTSPRTRGKLDKINDELFNIRNIPAHAGKTETSSES